MGYLTTHLDRILGAFGVQIAGIYTTPAQVAVIARQQAIETFNEIATSGSSGSIGGGGTTPPASGTAVLSFDQSNWANSNGNFISPNPDFSAPSGIARIGTVKDNAAPDGSTAAAGTAVANAEHGAKGGITGFLAGERRTFTLDMLYDEVPGCQFVFQGPDNAYGGGGYAFPSSGTVDGSSFADGFTIHAQSIAVSPVGAAWRRVVMDLTAARGATALTILHRNAPGVTSFKGYGGRPLHIGNPVFSARLN